MRVPVHNIGKERTVRNITIAIILHAIIMELVSMIETPFLVCAHRDSWDTLAILSISAYLDLVKTTELVF